MMEKPSLCVESTLKTMYYHILTYFKNTSKWSHFYMANTTDQLHHRIEKVNPHEVLLDEEQNTITDIIRQTALVFTTSIATLTPFSKTYTDKLVHELQKKLNKVPLSRWKQIPALFFWILAIACPSNCWRNCELQGRFWRRKMSVAALVISLETFNLGVMQMRFIYKVQRWIAEEAEKNPDIVGHYYNTAECMTM
jgi:hypothetical protein